jgi:muramoyltetrapeptide carboxypeptidase
MKCVFPEKLKKGDRLAVAAPSSCFDNVLFRKGLEIFEKKGFEVFVPNEIFAKNGYFAGTDKARADLINRLFSDDSVKGIICARGGYGAMRTLALLEVEIIRKNPKFFIGFSDITAILLYLLYFCQLGVYHGPTLSSLFNSDAETIKSLFASLTGSEKDCVLCKDAIILKSGTVTGFLTGGNLTTICHLLSTPYAPDFTNSILLLEDTGEAVYSIDRMLTQMKLAGSFDGVSGLVLGSFENCGKKKKIYKLFKDIFYDINIPILAGFDIGHGKKNYTVGLGILSVLDTSKKALIFS